MPTSKALGWTWEPMGALTMVSKVTAPNFLHVVLNNGAHESVGGQPSAGHLVDFTRVAEACGYATVGKAVESEEELIEALEKLKDCGKASFIDCRIHKGLTRKLPPIIFDHREAIDELINGFRRKCRFTRWRCRADATISEIWRATRLFRRNTRGL